MLSREDILRLANLSRLELSESEIVKLLEDMENIMEFTSKVSKYENDEIPCDCRVNIHRDYEKSEYDKCTREEVLSGGMGKNGFFFVKKYF